MDMISTVKPTRCTSFSNLFYFGITLYDKVSPIRYSRYIHKRTVMTNGRILQKSITNVHQLILTLVTA